MRLKFFLCGDIGSLPVGSASEVKVDRTLRLEWKFVALKALETYKQLRQPDDEEIDAINQLLKVMQEPRSPGR